MNLLSSGSGFVTLFYLAIIAADIIGDEHSSIVDGPLTSVLDGTLVKVLSWYDNEWGYSNRCVDVLQKVL